MDVAQIRTLRRRCCPSLLVGLLLLGLALPLLAHRLALLPAGYINIEYLAIGAIGVFLRRSVVFALLLIESLLDIALRISATYMLSPGNLLHSLRSVDSLSAHRVLEMSAHLALIAAACAIVARTRPRPEDRPWVAGTLLLVIFLVASAALLLGKNPFKNVDRIYASRRLARCPVVSLAILESFVRHVDLASRKADGGRMDSASSQALDFLSRPGIVSSPNVVLILVESWGNPQDAHLAQAIGAAYEDPLLASKYDISRGLVAFRGSTVPAEARELCQSSMGFYILNAPPESLRGCLPDWFRARNYRSLSVHGYIGSMFQRTAWYPRIGFQRSWFGPELNALKLPNCDGAFPGICDAAIAGWIGTSLLSADTGKPLFVYWVTLNSHLPVPARPDLPNDGACSAIALLRDSGSLCSWFRLVRNVHQSVQQLALRPSARPTLFVVVGDHAPPFADPGLRQAFSATEVPYVVLTPRAEVSP